MSYCIQFLNELVKKKVMLVINGERLEGNLVSYDSEFYLLEAENGEGFLVLRKAVDIIGEAPVDSYATEVGDL